MNSFDHVDQLSPAQIGILRVLRGEYKKLSALLDDMCPKSRELSIAQTNLEQSAMWANKSATHG